ncbi:MAG: phage head closure protein [Peptostreptococcaceae bacterium]
MNDVIELLTLVPDTDENGFEVNIEIKREVFADKKSVRASEFYQAQSQGFKVDVMFNIKPYEYDDEEYLIFEKLKYKIERLYEKDSENLEIVCSKVK